MRYISAILSIAVLLAAAPLAVTAAPRPPGPALVTAAPRPAPTPIPGPHPYTFILTLNVDLTGVTGHVPYPPTGNPNDYFPAGGFGWECVTKNSGGILANNENSSAADYGHITKWNGTITVVAQPNVGKWGPPTTWECWIELYASSDALSQPFDSQSSQWKGYNKNASQIDVKGTLASVSPPYKIPVTLSIVPLSPIKIPIKIPSGRVGTPVPKVTGK